MYYDQTKGCNPERNNDGKNVKGHWEKLPDKQDSYILINGLKPSGIPNSQVVSESESVSP